MPGHAVPTHSTPRSILHSCFHHLSDVQERRRKTRQAHFPQLGYCEMCAR